MTPEQLEESTTPAERQALMTIWKYHRCGICGYDGFCAHREPELELAELAAAREAEEARLRALKIPVQPHSAIVRLLRDRRK